MFSAWSALKSVDINSSISAVFALELGVALAVLETISGVVEKDWFKKEESKELSCEDEVDDDDDVDDNAADDTNAAKSEASLADRVPSSTMVSPSRSSIDKLGGENNSASSLV